MKLLYPGILLINKGEERSFKVQIAMSRARLVIQKEGLSLVVIKERERVGK